MGARQICVYLTGKRAEFLGDEPGRKLLDMVDEKMDVEEGGGTARGRMLRVRLTEWEHEELKRRAFGAGVSVSEWVRRRVLAEAVPVPGPGLVYVGTVPSLAMRLKGVE